MEQIFVAVAIGLATTAVTALVNALVRRFRFTSKNDELVSEMREELAELNRGQRVVFKLLLPLLLKAKDGKTNGELREALRLYNEYMQEK